MFANLKRRNALSSLSRFAGWHLGRADYHLCKSGAFLPFGMTGTVSVWSGRALQLTIIGIESPDLAPKAVEEWLLMDHGKADQVGVAIDAWITLPGRRDKTAAVCVSVRPRDFSTQIIIYQPYTPCTAETPIVFDRPVVDAPAEHRTVLSESESIIASVLKGPTTGMGAISSDHYRH